MNIDRNWLEQHSPAPYYLTEEGTTYVLQTDVTTEGTAFVITGKNVTFDLNGHTVTYDNSPQLVVENYSFEQGTDSLADNWDFGGGFDAERFQGEFLSNQVYDGSYSLRFTAPTGPQEVRSVGTITLEANTTYSLSAMFQRDKVAVNTGYVRLEGQNVPTRQEVSWGQTNWRGIQFRETVFTTGATAETYQVVVGVDQADTANFYIDDIHLQRTHVYGVSLGAFEWKPQWYPGIDTFGDADGATVTNGTIIQGTGGATNSHGIFSYRASAAEISNLPITVHGTNSVNIETASSPDMVIHGNTLYNNVTTIQSRDQLDGASIRAIGHIYDNVIAGGVQGGIVVAGGTSQVHHNSITLHSKYTNSFGIHLRNDQGSDVHDNLLDYSGEVAGGRGIFVGGDTSNGTKIYNNTITVQDRARNQEYGGAALGGTYGIQIETASNVEVYGNTVTAIADEAAAYAFRKNKDGINNYIHDNIFIATRTGGGVEAATLKLADIDGNSNLRFEQNELWTNYGWVGDTASITDLELRGNTLRAEGDLTGFEAVESDNWKRDDPSSPLRIKDLRFVDNIYADANSRQLLVDSPVHHRSGSGPDTYSSFIHSFTITVRAQKNSGSRVAGALVEISDNTGATVFVGTTDNNGDAIAVLVEFRTQGGTKTTSNPHVLSVNGRSRELIVDSKKTVTVVARGSAGGANKRK